MRIASPAVALLVLTALAGALALSRGAGAAETDACVTPTAGPVWIDYGDGSVPPEVREIFGRPGVVAAAWRRTAQLRTLLVFRTTPRNGCSSAGPKRTAATPLARLLRRMATNRHSISQ